MANVMSYGGAGEPAPAPGTTAGYVFYKAMFDHIFAQHNADDTIIGAATSLATASQLVKRDGSGGAAFAGTLTAAAISASGNVGVGGTLNVTGNAGIAGTLGVTGTITGTLSGNASSATSATTAGSLLTPQPVTSTLADYKVTTSATADSVTVSAGGNYADSAGTSVPATGTATLSLSNATSVSVPTAGNIQYVAITKALGGTLTATGGPVAASPALPSFPLGHKWLAMVKRGSSGSPAAGDITDHRYGDAGGGGSGSSGADTLVRASSILTKGTSATISAYQDVTSAATAASLNIDPAIMYSTGAGQVGFDKIRDWYVQPDMGGRIQPSGSNTVQIVAGTGTSGTGSPVTVGKGGLLKTATAPVVSGAASGTAGPRSLILELSPASSASFTASLVAVPAPTATQINLGVVGYWDGSSTLQTGITDLSALASLGAQQVSLTQASWSLGTALSSQTSANFSAIATGQMAAAVTFYVPTQMRGIVTMRALGNTAGAATFAMTADINNSVFGRQQAAYDYFACTAAVSVYKVKAIDLDVIVQSGINTLTVAAQIDTGTINISQARAVVALFHL